MNRNQAYTLIRQTFTQAFDKNLFSNFNQNLLNHIDESKAASWDSPNVKNAFKEHIQRYERIGTYTSPENEKLDVLIVHLANESKLERARTAIRNFVADHLKTRDEKDAALVAFVSPSEATWRFSYVKMEYATVEKDSGEVGVETHLTPARRFSYIVGEGESCHTAQTRFLGLLQDTESDPLLADIEEAFSVEAVTKEFFTKYTELFEEIHKELEELLVKNMAISDEFTAKNVNSVDFAKKLMGQIVFLYFLQKKGWLGVGKGQDWGSGLHDFLRRLANGEHGEYNNFFNDILEPLFYDTLAIDRGHEAWCDHFKCRVPFLNGGLFEPLGNYDWRKTDIILSNKLFTNSEFIEEGITGTGVLDVFDRYNFTVNEADPLEKEVAIDPEMLGKVFENLIEENHRKGLGAYYTPREIVHYMCQESLINYLDTVINKKKQTEVSRADIETFIHLGEQISHYQSADTKYPIKIPESIENHARLIDDKLAMITVCDPAVGSGAFPVGMMTEIVRGRCALTPYFNDFRERTPYLFKRHAIQNCLYGVDVDAGAVEIAKLRLWLSLVVDEEDVKQIKPLPNLDYKIVVGDSLLGVERNLFNNDLFSQLEDLKPLYFDETDPTKKVAFKNGIDGLIHQLTNGKETFDFEIYFSEVFHQYGGFDVVIANPPYDVLNITEGQRISPKLLETIRAMPMYEIALGGKLNFFRLFMARAFTLMDKTGVLTYIIPYAFMCDSSSKKLRGFVLKEKQLKFVEAFPERDDPKKRLFEAVKMSTCIVCVMNIKQTLSFPVRIHYAREISFDVPTVHFDANTIELLDPTNLSIPLMTDYDLKIVMKILCSSGKRFSDIIRCYQGEVNLTVHKRFLRKDRGACASMIKGATIQRYLLLEHMSQGEIEFIDSHAFLKNNESPKSKHHQVDRIVMQGITGVNERVRLKATILGKGVFCGHSVNYIMLKDETYSKQYIVGLLNSKLYNWLFKLFSTNSNVNSYEVENLPIPTSNTSQQEIANMVDKIFNITEGNDYLASVIKQAEVKEYERRIDQIIFRLYDLTPEEIEVIV